MDSDEIRYLLGNCFHLKYYFYVVFAADNFPKLTRKWFVVVNASSAQYEGSHWIVVLFHENKVYLADPLGLPIQNYQILYSRLVQFYNEITQVVNLKLVQNQNSKLFGLFCIYIVHVMFGYEYPLMLNMNDLHFCADCMRRVCESKIELRLSIADKISKKFLELSKIFRRTFKHCFNHFLLLFNSLYHSLGLFLIF